MAKNTRLPDVGFGPGRKRGGTKTIVRFSDEQLEKLRAAAMGRMVERKLARMDTGELVREAVDWYDEENRARVIAGAHKVGDGIVQTIPRLLEAGEFEAADQLIGTFRGLIETLRKTLGSPSEHLEQALSMLEREIQAKLAERGTKGKRGRK